MQLYSTNNRNHLVSLKEAVFRGLPPDNGLYMPLVIPALPASFFEQLPTLSLPEMGLQICQTLFGDDIPAADLRTIVENAIDFPAPLVRLDESTYILELFHGPSLAFKDFGARFMAQLMSYFNRGEDRELVILVATSGDTGGAVAAGFHRTPGIKVVILYPSGKVSPLQEKQLTTLGDNIAALEVDGTFDDCQALVKQAFLDSHLREQIRLSSANSINISRLVPQSFYYFSAYQQLPDHSQTPVFCIPSGNFGNLTAGLLAQRMGLPVHHFIAATNANDVVPAYLRDGQYTPRPSVPTLSNAMDVGAPSNFARMLDLAGDGIQVIKPDSPLALGHLRQQISGFAISDQRTKDTMREVDAAYDYVLDPHGAVGYLALRTWQQANPRSNIHPGIVLETAHPAKFLEEVEAILDRPFAVPERLSSLATLQKKATFMSTAYQPFKDYLLANYVSV